MILNLFGERLNTSQSYFGLVPGTAAVRHRRLLLRSQTVKTIKLPAPNC